VETNQPTRDFALVGCGLGVRWSQAIFFNFGYQAQVGQRNYFAQDVELSMHVAF